MSAPVCIYSRPDLTSVASPAVQEHKSVCGYSGALPVHICVSGLWKSEFQDGKVSRYFLGQSVDILNFGRWICIRRKVGDTRFFNCIVCLLLDILAVREEQDCP